jgi:putative DNA primase/helicase
MVMASTAKAQDHFVYQSDNLTRLHESMQPMGLSIESPANIILNGKFHNIGTIENRRKKSGWYVGEEYRLGGHQFLLCTFGDFKQDRQEVFKSWGEKDRISKEVLYDLASKQQEQRKKEEKFRKQRQKQAADQAVADWASLSESGESDYLQRKGVQGFGVKYGTENDNPFIAIPISGIDGKLRGLQKIYDQNLPNQDRNKDFTIGTEKKGGHYLIGEVLPFNPLCFAEGIATAASIHEATNYPVVVCFDAGNIKPVVKAYRTKYHTQQFIICADNDQWKDVNKNPGIEKATEVAKAFYCFVAKPDFTDLDISKKPTDFNDLQLLTGNEEVLKQIQQPVFDFSKSQVTEVTRDTINKDEDLSGNPDQINDVTEVAVQWPGENERPRYGVYEQWQKINDVQRKPGVYYHGISHNGDSTPPSLIDTWICSPMYVRAITRDRNNFNYGRMLEFKTSTKSKRHWCMPMSLLAGSGDELRRELLSMGCEIDPKNRNQLPLYLQSIPPKTVLKSALNIGWHDNAFVLPDRTIGSTEVFYQSSHLEQREYTQNGPLEEWQQHISRLCPGNPLLVLSISIAFSGPLLRKLHTDGGGFHIYGDSSKGKSTGLRVACTVWGGDDYRKTWKATGNGMEGVAAIFNDSLLAIDEISEAEGKEISGIVYALANGVGKTRAMRDGTAKPSHRWVVAVISNGERTVASHMAEKGMQIKAGQEVRLLNIPIFGQYGAFDELHEYENGRQFSDALQTNSKKHYGTAGIAFLEKLCVDQQDFGALLEQFLKAFDDGNLSSQEGRAAKRFAITAMAGELAISYGITGWKTQTALKAAVQCFQRWRENFGSGDQEERQILEAIHDFIDKHGDSRFSEPNSQEKIKDRAGYYRSNGDGNREYLFTASGLREALIGYDFKRGREALKKAGMLIPGKNGDQQQMKVNGRNTKVYNIRMSDGHE